MHAPATAKGYKINSDISLQGSSQGDQRFQGKIDIAPQQFGYVCLRNIEPCGKLSAVDTQLFHAGHDLFGDIKNFPLGDVLGVVLVCVRSVLYQSARSRVFIVKPFIVKLQKPYCSVYLGAGRFLLLFYKAVSKNDNRPPIKSAQNANLSGLEFKKTY